MSLSTHYYFREKPMALVTKINHNPYTPSIRSYFEDFLLDCLGVHPFEKAIFYIDARSKSLDSVSVYQGYFDKLPRLEKLISEMNLKWVFSANLEINPLLVVEGLIRRIDKIFTEKLKLQDSYDITIHVRLLGKRVTSFSSDHYRLKLDFTSFKLKQFLEKQGVKSEIFGIKDPKISVSVTPTSYKSLNQGL